MSTTSRIYTLVRQALPKGKPARIIWHPTGFGKSQILRIVTPAWKSLPRSDRIFKIQQALEPKRTPQERAKIFRISVLTAREFERLIELLPAERPSASNRANSRRFSCTRQPWPSNTPPLRSRWSLRAWHQGCAPRDLPVDWRWT